MKSLGRLVSGFQHEAEAPPQGLYQQHFLYIIQNTYIKLLCIRRAMVITMHAFFFPAIFIFSFMLESSFLLCFYGVQSI